MKKSSSMYISGAWEATTPFLYPHTLFYLADGRIRILLRACVEQVAVHPRDGTLVLFINGLEAGPITAAERTRIIKDLTGRTFEDKTK